MTRGGSRCPLRSWGWILLPAAIAACSPTGPLPADFPACESEPAPDVPDEPTWSRDVGPIVQASCAACHGAGGAEPTNLGTYAVAAAHADDVAASVESGAMPPWPASSCCAPLDAPLALTASEAATIARWAQQGAPEGDPSTAPAPDPDPPPVDGWLRARGDWLPDLRVEWPQPYTSRAPEAGVPDQRCFIVDWPGAQTQLITGWSLDMADPDAVHHARLFAVPADVAEELRGRDAATDGPGWSCWPGLARDVRYQVGTWRADRPVAGRFDGELGRGLAPDAALVLMVRYARESTQVPAVVVSTSTRLDRALKTLLVAHPMWLLEDGMAVPAGQSDVMHYFAYEPALVHTSGKAFDVHGALLEMHTKGTRASLVVLRDGGARECLLHVEPWQHAWPGEYALSEPVRVEPGDRLYLECHWDNRDTSGSSPPVDLRWGRGGEVCLGLVAITEVD